jgi:hypothetical protein
MKHRIFHSPPRAPLLLDPLGTSIETPVDPRRGFRKPRIHPREQLRGTRRPWIFLSLSPQVAFHQCPKGTAECTARGAGNPRRGFKKPRIHPREQYQEVPVDHSPDPKPRIGANYSFAYNVDGWPSCSSRLKMHSTSDRRALRYARREGREGQLKTLGVPVPLALRCIPQVTEGHCGMHGERGGKPP